MLLDRNPIFREMGENMGRVTEERKLIQSPLNYTGGKYRLLPQILPLFPKEMNLFVDLFCGGGNVGINVPCRKTVFNDIDPVLMRLYRTFRQVEKTKIFSWIEEAIDRYGLSHSAEYGYDYYHCNSSAGLGSYNRERFLKLRADYNQRDQDSAYYDILLYVLIVYAFNNQIRFNRSGEYNLPVGKRDFNLRMRDKLSRFIDALQTREDEFTCCDFREFPLDRLASGSFLYADPHIEPPYLITCATYNEQGGWNETAERELLAFLDEADRRKIRFALSNVLRSKGKENPILLEWLDCNPQYCVVPLDYHYGNANYHTKDKSSNSSEEVLIVNYPMGGMNSGR